MKFKGTIIGAASGSVDGLTFSRNRGGQYIRNRATPVNSQTPQQQAVRALFGNLNTAWQSTLTAAQRAAWDAYALAVLVPDALGEPRNIGGKGWYTACNVPRLQAGLTRIDVAPTVLSMASLTSPGITSITASTSVAVVTFTNTDAWATAVGGALLVLGSRGVSPATNYFKGPYRYAGKVSGAVTPPTSPANITIPFTLAVGQICNLQFRAVLADGRISPIVRLGKTCV